MRLEVCPDDSVLLGEEMWWKEKTLWCGAKLPCGRCIAVKSPKATCGRLPIYESLPCEDCKARFVCFTCGHATKYPQAVAIQKQIIEALKE